MSPPSFWLVGWMGGWVGETPLSQLKIGMLFLRKVIQPSNHPLDWHLRFNQFDQFICLVFSDVQDLGKFASTVVSAIPEGYSSIWWYLLSLPSFFRHNRDHFCFTGFKASSITFLYRNILGDNFLPQHS